MHGGAMVCQWLIGNVVHTSAKEDEDPLTLLLHNL